MGALGGVAAGIAGDRVATWPDPLRRWAEDAPECPPNIIDGVREALGDGYEPFSALYEASIVRSHRRRLGTVFTPEPLVDHMLELAAAAIGDEPHCIVDAGAGVGAFTVAAARRWHCARIIAVDVNVVTLGLLAARIAFEIDAEPDDAYTLQSIELVHGDYLDGIADRFGAGHGRLLALGNPPYTRIQELPLAYRAKATKLCNGIVDSGHANLAVLFQAATLRHMHDHDASCMVLPGSTGYTRASQGLRQALRDSKRPVVIHSTLATARPFTGNSVQASIVAIGSVGNRTSPIQMAHVCFDDKTPSVIERWEQRRGKELSNWIPTNRARSGGDGVYLDELAIVRRGIATGANSAFFLADTDAATLPHEVVTAGVLTLKGFPHNEFNSTTHLVWGGKQMKRWLLAIPQDFDVNAELLAYLQQIEDEVRDRFLVSQREPWYSVTGLTRPDLLFGPLSSNGFKIVLNTAHAVPSNNLFGITMRDGTPPEVLADWLRSKAGQQALLRASRRYHGGSHKLEPGDLKSVRVPANKMKSRSPAQEGVHID